MKGRPFNITSTRHIMSRYAGRKAYTGAAFELRTLVGNMKAQTLLHNYDVSDFQIDDLAEYAASVGTKLSDPRVTRVLNTIQSSSLLTARFIPAATGGTWELNLKDWTRAAPNVDKLISSLFDELTTPAKTFKTVQSQDGASPQCLVFAWDTATFGPVIEAVSRSVPKMTNYVRGKLKDPRKWFELKLASFGFDPSYLIRGPLVQTAINVNDGNIGYHVGNAYKRAGCVTIVGPTDLFQKSQLYYYPAWAADVGVIGVGVWAGKEVPVSGGTYHVPLPNDGWVDVSAAVASANVGAVKAARFSATSGVPGSSIWENIGAGVATPLTSFTATGDTSLVCMKLPFVDFASNDANIANLRTSLAPLFDSSVRGALGVTPVYAVQKSAAWRIAFPNYISQLLFHNPIVSTVTDSAGVKRYEMRCDVLGMASTFQSLRDFAVEMKSHPNATATDKSNFQKFIDQTEALADDMVYTSIYANGRAAPSKAHVANLTLVKKVSDAGVNIWSEKIGTDATFDDLAKKLQKDYDDRVTYYVFSTVRSDMAGMDTLVSVRVQTTLDEASKWVVYGTVDPVSGIPRFTGSFDEGTTETLTSAEAAIIVAGGGVQGAGADDSAFTAAGFGAGWRSQLSDLAKTEVFSSSGGVSYSQPNARAPMELSTNAFCNAYGMPVMNYSDTDSFVRGCLLFKGVKGDPSGLVAQSFFVNTLDIG